MQNGLVHEKPKIKTSDEMQKLKQNYIKYRFS
jgi:hypothetical protein